MTNAVRDLLSCYKTGVVPHHWKALYVSAHNMPLVAWIEDLVARLENVCGYKDCLSLGAKHSFALGRMFAPEAFILATRQQTAQVCLRIYMLRINLLLMLFFFAAQPVES